MRSIGMTCTIETRIKLLSLTFFFFFFLIVTEIWQFSLFSCVFFVGRENIVTKKKQKLFCFFTIKAASDALIYDSLHVFNYSFHKFFFVPAYISMLYHASLYKTFFFHLDNLFVLYHFNFQFIIHSICNMLAVVCI